ncbi:MAG TPA: L,D-transpeptidase [Chthoniobacterales bacterium]|nr:L,D-transpeptidase [Chthoniobacterales bacterium]
MKKSAQAKIHISVADQQLTLKSGRKKLASYPISTSRFGLGAKEGSMKTPTGRFRIVETIGGGAAPGTVFKNRQPVKATKKMLRDEDLVMTRILWLDGLDPGNANTHDRFIYIHGTNHEESIGKPASHGCIRMRKADLVELFEQVGEDTPVTIKA